MKLKDHLTITISKDFPDLTNPQKERVRSIILYYLDIARHNPSIIAYQENIAFIYRRIEEVQKEETQK